MLKQLLILLQLALVGSAVGAEHFFDFGKEPLKKTPAGFESWITGEGEPGKWLVIHDEVPSAFKPLSANAPVTSKQAVLAQLSTNLTDERFPLLVYTNATYGDFKFTTRFKTVSGKVEQMAGVAFRIQDKNNYYVIRASALGNTLKFYKFVNGQRSVPIGPDIKIASNTWHELTVDCKGNSIRCFLNGKEAMPVLNDNTFVTGKIGFWTKSDSVTYFSDARINYTPREFLAAQLVRDMMQRYPRVLYMRVYAKLPNTDQPQIIASTVEGEIGKPAETKDADVIERGVIYYGKGKEEVAVTLPLQDRNGENAAAVKITMKSFPGQTEKNAIARALPIKKDMEFRIQSSKDLYE